MIKQSEWILMHLLKCGQCDLSILEDIEYDLDDILDVLVENDSLSLESLISEVFHKGINELYDLVTDVIPEIIDNLKILDQTLPKRSDSEEILDKKEKELNENDVYLSHKYDIEWGDDIPEYIKELKEINPRFDTDFYINCLDTHIYFENHKKIYSKFFREQVSQIEKRIGFNFSNF